MTNTTRNTLKDAPAAADAGKQGQANSLYAAIHAATLKAGSAQKAVSEAFLAGNGSAFVECATIVESKHGADKAAKNAHLSILRMQLRRAALAARKGTQHEGKAATVKIVDKTWTFVEFVEPKEKDEDKALGAALQLVLDNFDNDSVRTALESALKQFNNAIELGLAAELKEAT